MLVSSTSSDLLSFLLRISSTSCFTPSSRSLSALLSGSSSTAFAAHMFPAKTTADPNQVYDRRFSHNFLTDQPKMLLESAKKNAAIRAVSDWVKSPGTLGVGSGSTVVYAVEYLRENIDKYTGLVCIPTSFQARQLIVQSGLTMGSLETHPELDVVIDGADEVDDDRTLIKGGGGCLLQEKLVASCTKKLIIIADFTKNSNRLGQQYKKGIPIEVVPEGYVPVQRKIEAMFGGMLRLRMAVAKAGPIVTDNGNFILDWVDFPEDSNWQEVNRALKMIPGVAETGLFVGMAHSIYFGMSDGTLKVQGPPSEAVANN